MSVADSSLISVLILLPPRCLEDQKGLTASGDQAPDLHLLGSWGGI
jgi:hypothetical protein